MCSRCFAEPYQTALLAVASTASPTGSPKSSVKPASSRHPENGQRLAANADHPRVTEEGSNRIVEDGNFYGVRVFDSFATGIPRFWAQQETTGWEAPCAHLSEIQM